MRANDVRNWLTGRLFRPFRIYLTNGRAFDIRSPSHAHIGATTIVIDTSSPNLPPSLEVEVSLVHITHIEPISPSQEPSTN